MSESLPNVFWIGGSPCAGKSSIGDLLGERHGLEVYHLDEHFQDHLARATEASAPLLVEARTLSQNDIWSQSVENLLRNELDFYEQEFPLILADLEQASAERCVIAEGTGMLPHLVAPFLAERVSAVWLAPTPEFQLHHYAKREWIRGILDQCDDPGAAFENWMGRDIQFARHVTAEAQRLNLPAIIIDGSRSLEAVLTEVESTLYSSGLLERS